MHSSYNVYVKAGGHSPAHHRFHASDIEDAVRQAELFARKYRVFEEIAERYQPVTWELSKVVRIGQTLGMPAQEPEMSDGAQLEEDRSIP